MEKIKSIIQAFCLSILIVLWVFTNVIGHTLDFEGLIPQSLHSDHNGQCDPHCYNQNNGGIGFSIRYRNDNKHLDLGLGRMYLINSFGYKGRVDWFQFERLEYESKMFRTSMSVWLMTIYGYKNEDGSNKIVKPPPWPKFQVGINPVYFFMNNPIFINYNIVYFPGVKIDWFSISYLWRF